MAKKLTFAQMDALMMAYDFNGIVTANKANVTTLKNLQKMGFLTQNLSVHVWEYAITEAGMNAIEAGKEWPMIEVELLKRELSKAHLHCNVAYISFYGDGQLVSKKNTWFNVEYYAYEYARHIEIAEKLTRAELRVERLNRMAGK